jgi:hypothetical protein
LPFPAELADTDRVLVRRFDKTHPSGLIGSRDLAGQPGAPAEDCAKKLALSSSVKTSSISSHKNGDEIGEIRLAE